MVETPESSPEVTASTARRESQRISPDTLLRSEPDLLVFVSSKMTEELSSARKETVRAFEDFPCTQPWAFEFTPASSESAPDGYLRHARDADFLVWLVGAATTQPVVEEINTRIAAGRRLLVFRLPADERDTLTRELFTTVRRYCKTQDVSDSTSLYEALTASLADEITRALREPAPPARRQKLQQWRDSSVAKCRQLWTTLGVPSDLATAFAGDPSVGSAPPLKDAAFQMVVGAPGAGKSLAASRIFQQAVEAALRDGTQRFPVFIDARELTGPLEEYIEQRTVGLVQPSYQRTLVIVDGLDERGVSQANEVITQIEYYVDAYPLSRLVATSRQLPGLRLPDEHRALPELTDDEAIRLIGRIAGRAVRLAELYGWSESIQKAARRPLFAVMVGSELRRGESMSIDSPAELINRLARQVVEQSGPQGEELNRLLQRLAVRAISTGRRVRKSDVSLSHVQQRWLADSRLVEESADTLDFSHEVLREWYAARALIEGTVSIGEVLPASDRWITVFGIVVESDSKDARVALRRELAASDPGLAGLLLNSAARDHGVCQIGAGSWATAEQVGGALWDAMDAWRTGLGELFREIGPVAANGGTAAVGVQMDSTRVTTSWYAGRRNLPQRVVVLRDTEASGVGRLEPGWDAFRTELTPRGREWPWMRTKRYLVDSLAKTIMSRRLALPAESATRELVWTFALAITRRGEFSPGVIQAGAVLESVRQMIAQAEREAIVFEIGRLEIRPFELRLMEAVLEGVVQRGERTVSDPWGGFDQDVSGRTGGLNTWDFYSDERLMERSTAVYSAALQLYIEMVDRWFGSFRRRLKFARLFPVELEGRLRKVQRGHMSGAPSLRWCARALPHGERSRVTLEWNGSDFDLMSFWREEEENLRSVRTGSDATPCGIRGELLPGIGSTRPATNLAHAWLVCDLRELGWTELIGVSLR